MAKSTEILSCFRQKPSGLTLAEISNLAQINKSSAHRLLSQMALGGLIERADDGRYVIGHTLFQLGMLAPKPQELRGLARPLLNDLARETGETASLAVMDGPDAVLIDVVDSVHEFRVVSKIGSARPVHLTALGKSAAAFMPEAELDIFYRSLRLPLEAPTPNSISDLSRLRDELRRIRHQGYAVSDQEYIIGVRAVAAPVFSRHGKVEAALGISGPASRLSLAKIAEIAASVMTAADSVTERLGGASPMIRSVLERNGNPAPKTGELRPEEQSAPLPTR